ncbi:hypothetical protein [Thermogutta sp.]|uniref:carboxypeptidase-like regulatory domain-containing protein n=2 Tax=Thermogutta sp. TaxID=1962930 RepID=UPI003C7D4208
MAGWRTSSSGLLQQAGIAFLNLLQEKHCGELYGHAYLSEGAEAQENGMLLTTRAGVWSLGKTLVVGFIFVLLISLGGCGGAKRSVPGRPKTVPVKVTVKYKGQPVAEANVQLLPASGGHAATGLTDAQGVARLTTFEKNDGVVPGSYRVTIRKSVLVQGGSTDPDAPPVPAKYREELPAKYASPETSGLTAEVTESTTEFTFDLPD